MRRRAALAAWLLVLCCCAAPAGGWTPEEMAVLRGLWIGSLPPPPPVPSNRAADDPDAARLGQRLFFDRRLSANGRVACVSCHRPDWAFTDGFPRGEGLAMSARNTMTLLGSAWSPWLFWDGRSDSLWAQALAALESPTEQGATRAQVWRAIRDDAGHRALYRRAFGALPDAADVDAVTRVFANTGKALEAYQRRLAPGPSRFDRYVAAQLAGDPAGGAQLSGAEVAGLRLFIGKGGCTRCHSGPLLTDFSFHDTGVPETDASPSDPGRERGARLVLVDEFNCRGRHSDSGPGACAGLAALAAAGAPPRRGFRTPTLRNLPLTAPYMHNGVFGHLSHVLDHYNRAPRQVVGETELRPLGFEAAELRQLEAFLRALDSPAADSERLHRPGR